LASDEHPRQIRKFSRSLVSRFLSGMVVRIDRPDRATRALIVRRLAAERSLLLHPAVEELVADRCVGSVREIEGALTRVAAFAALEGRSGGSDERPIGLAVAERALAEEGGRPSGPVRISEVIDRVCARTGVEREELFGNQRHRRIVVARGLAAFLARELTNHSFPEIGRALGRDNHSTVHGAVRRIEQMLEARERIECADDAVAGEDGKAPLSEIVAHIRHDILHRAGGR
jgi:chromosomal replication initiator protein